MSSDNETKDAWIAIPSAGELAADVADEIGDVSKRIGFVPNVARLLKDI